MTALLVAFSALLGLAVGSFLNVVIWRVPRGESVVRPPSACPRCGHAIRPRDNVPVLGWLLLRGRCRDCGEPIAVRYPLVEGVTAVLFGLVALRFAAAPAAIPAFLFLTAVGIALALIDLDVHRLPNALVLPSYPVLAVLLALASVDDWSAMLRALIGGVALYAFYFALMFVSELVLGRTGMGFGDVKLAGLLGGAMAWVGWGALVVGGFGAFLLGGLASLLLILTGRGGRGTQIPFGPWMIIGAALGVAVGEQLWSAYLQLLA
ncbi:prepilin peptidase [Actinotalea sp. M2MS4P-6]|nr:A24 family peptidase [Actinotalea sp. M2MS4P-6]MCV2394578.1 prepilin peptidase [Actinotalea sp. M2MS4P-6]